jgi:hypothetical protein
MEVGSGIVGQCSHRASFALPHFPFRVVFLSLGWHWFVTAIVALLAGVTETKLRKMLVLFCGLAVLLEAGVGASMMGFFMGNEMIGAAALLLVCGGLLFDQTGAQT